MIPTVLIRAPHLLPPCAAVIVSVVSWPQDVLVVRPPSPIPGKMAGKYYWEHPTPTVGMPWDLHKNLRSLERICTCTSLQDSIHGALSLQEMWKACRSISKQAVLQGSHPGEVGTCSNDFPSSHKKSYSSCPCTHTT